MQTVPNQDSQDAQDADRQSVVQLAGARKQPPPETPEGIARRRWLLFSFWAVAVFLGLPTWLWTTAIHRASLPLTRMNSWAAGQACQLEFPLHVAIAGPALRPRDLDHLIKLTQQTLDDHDEGSLHHLRFALPAALNVEPDLTVYLDADQAQQPGANPKSGLRQYEPILDITHAPFASASPGTPALLVLARSIVDASRRVFADEQVRLLHLLSSANYGVPPHQRLSQVDIASLDQRSTRAFKYSSVYHLTFSLFTGAASPSSWEIRAALDEYLSPLLSSFSTISTFTIDTQIQHYASLSPSIRGPTYDHTRQAWSLGRPDLSGFINAAEWPLSPTIGGGPTINFVLYVPSPKQQPLVIEGTEATSWLIPQWGGVKILDHQSDKMGDTTLTKEHLYPVVLVIADQLSSLLGLPSTPASLPLRLSSLTRERATALILSASSTLGALSRLTLKLTSIAIPDNVAISVDETLQGLEQACSALREGRYEDALRSARDAEQQAEMAFFDPSMVGQVYFPDEHKVAVYVPLLGPMAVPLVMALVKEIKAKFHK